jgi:hypothetical protein
MFDESQKRKSLPEVDNSDGANVEPGTFPDKVENVGRPQNSVGEEGSDELKKLREKYPPVYSKEFRFKNGELIRQAPDVPLVELYSHDGFTQEVIAAIDSYGLAIATGQSGIGKSGYFIGKNRKKIRTGGVMELLQERNELASVFDFQDRLTPEILEKLINGEPLPEKIIARLNADKLIFDESVILERKPQLTEALIKLGEQGKRILLMGGGGLTSVEQAKRIADTLGQYGISVNSEQIFTIPAYILTDKQAEEILVKSSTNIDKIPMELLHERAGEIIRLAHEAYLPLVSRAISNLPDPSYDQDEFFYKSMQPKMINEALEDVLINFERI